MFIKPGGGDAVFSALADLNEQPMSPRESSLVCTEMMPRLLDEAGPASRIRLELAYMNATLAAEAAINEAAEAEDVARAKAALMVEALRAADRAEREFRAFAPAFVDAGMVREADDLSPPVYSRDSTASFAADVIEVEADAEDFTRYLDLESVLQ